MSVAAALERSDNVVAAATTLSRRLKRGYLQATHPHLSPNTCCSMMLRSVPGTFDAPRVFTNDLHR